MVRRALVLLLLAALAGGTLAGCGEADPREAVTQYLDAVAGDDGERACEYLTPAARQQAVQAFAELGATDCPGVINAVVREVFGADAGDLRDESATGERISGDRAAVRATLDDRSVDVALAREDGDWMLDQAGVGARLLGGSPGG